MAHKHRIKASRDVGFSGPIYPARRANPAAHGGITTIRICACGAERRTNVNQWHREEGFWGPSDDARDDPDRGTIGIILDAEDAVRRAGV